MKKINKDLKILTIQDISCFGQCSTTVALPILSACGYETVILPTSILSTHTSGFNNFVAYPLEKQINSFLSHWKKENLKFDVIYTGYLGNLNLIDMAISAIEQLKKEDTLIFVDPALGDCGKLYPSFNLDYALKMNQLIAHAHIVKANVTEACFMSKTKYQEHYDHHYIQELIIKLSSICKATIILSDVSFKDDTTGVYIYENGQFSYYEHQKIGKGFHGTGDIFSSSFLASFLLGNNIYNSAKYAADFVYDCINNTINDQNHWYGVKYEPLLNDYINRLKGK